MDGGTVAGTLTAHTLNVAALAVLPDGALASGSYDTTVRLWDVDAGACVATLTGHEGSVHALAVLADGRLASGSRDRTARLWDVATTACVGVLKGHARSVCVIAALPDGRLASGSWDRTIGVWDTRHVSCAGAAVAAAAAGDSTVRLTPVVVLEGHTDSVISLASLLNGRLASGSRDNTVRLWPLPPV